MLQRRQYQVFTPSNIQCNPYGEGLLLRYILKQRSR